MLKVRRGTMAHPDFQKQGLSTWLTKYCNRISDEVGGTIFVAAMPSSQHMFEQCGYVAVKTLKFDLKEDKTIVIQLWVMQRDPRIK